MDPGVASIELTVSALDSKASININGELYSAGAPKTISLKPGTNQIDVIVMARDGVTTKTYTVLIRRQESGGSDGGGNGNSGNGGNGSNGGEAGNGGGSTGNGSSGNSANGGSPGSNGAGTGTGPTNGAHTLVMDAAQFQQALSDAQSHPSANQQLEFDLKGRGEQGVQLQLPLDELLSASKTFPNLTLALNTDKMTYRLPMQGIDFEGLAKGVERGESRRGYV
ncbi:cadherin-like beta sandwich domain-containing protein [Paenibacillus sp. AR247]|uniref:cadherin-like beta sandwich domain-containing protein n=1 Tax=Paenibacillus sp. AR247 TaxID=1631599 RepID=UPI000CF8EC08|nr:hypothetical protein CPT76_01275 [Paenibacillus sp. AR247]